MGIIVEIILMAIAAFFSAKLTPGVTIPSFSSAIIVAIVLALLNTFVKPILEFVSIPVTFLTLGLFTFVINALIILIAAHFVKAFNVSGFWVAMLYSIIFSVISWILNGIFN